MDVLARRTRLAFINARAAHEALPRVIAIMAEELKVGTGDVGRLLKCDGI